MVKNIIGVYIIGWCLTFGYFYNNAECRPANARILDCDTDNGVGAVIGATVWPIYWPARLGIYATLWTKGF